MQGIKFKSIKSILKLSRFHSAKTTNLRMIGKNVKNLLKQQHQSMLFWALIKLN